MFCHKHTVSTHFLCVLRYKLLNKKLINPELVDSLDWQTAWVKNE